MQIFTFVKLVVSSTLVGLILGPVSAPVSAMASPGPYPMPFQNADYNAHILPGPSRTHYSHRWHREVDHNATVLSGHHSRNPSSSTGSLSKHKHKLHMSDPSVTSASRLHRRQGSSMGGLLSSLSGFSGGSQSDSQDLQNMASQSASQSPDDASYHQNAASKFSSFQQNAQGFDGILGQLAADKGLANYDKNDQLETVLKEFVNANKDALSAVNTMIQNDPTLGPILGPIVYEIKCIIDDVLDITENLTDGVLNSLKPLLTGVSGNAGDMTCSSQLKVLGFCV